MVSRPGAGDEPRVIVRVTGDSLSLDALSRAVADPRAGAVVIFEGVTREVPRLEYEAYTQMAEERIASIAADCAARHALTAIAIEHRSGSVGLGEPSVIVAVSAPHRGEAFAAAREAIDRVKQEAPIWKREHPESEPPRWVEGQPPGGERRVER
jgi:molybdopterin synthase catalytic subunit